MKIRTQPILEWADAMGMVEPYLRILVRHNYHGWSIVYEDTLGRFGAEDIPDHIVDQMFE